MPEALREELERGWLARAARRGGWAAALLAVTVALPMASAAEGWRPLFDGRGLGDWKPTAFGGEGEIRVVDGSIRIPMGADLSGVTWQGKFPRQGYEIALQARRVEGHDFFCGLTFPVGEDHCSLILGGWGGTVVGLSSIDGRDAADNETTTSHTFELGRWYDVVVRVTPERIECLLDGEVVVDQLLAKRRISVRQEVVPCQPLGIATYATVGEVRRIRWRPIGGTEAKP